MALSTKSGFSNLLKEVNYNKNRATNIMVVLKKLF
jgi:hypothetical protein